MNTPSDADVQRFIDIMRRDEGFRGRPYKDTVGKSTVLIGHNLDASPLCEEAGKAQFKYDMAIVEDALDAHLSWWRNLDVPRQGVLMNMCFNMGIDTLITFKNTLKAIQEGRYEAAATGMEQSKWHTQVGDRAKRLEKTMRTGQWV